MPKLSLELMARSAEQTDNGWLSIRDISLPGLLSSDSEPQLLELLSGQGELPPAAAAPVGARDAGVSSSGLWLLLMVRTVLAGTLLGIMLMGILWSGAKLVATLGGTVPARVELMGNLDGA